MITNLIIGLYTICTAGALVVLKLGSKNAPLAQFTDGRLDLNITVLTISGVILYGVSFLLYMYLISRFNLGYIIPLTTGVVYVLVFFASFTIFKEQFTAFKIAGIVLIVAGLVLLNAGKNDVETSQPAVVAPKEK